jgi:hypothetical protein
VFTWKNTHLLSSTGIYFDALRMKDRHIDSAFYTYNTGTVLQSNALLFEMTKKQT